MPVTIERSPQGETVTARLRGEIDHHGAARIREEIDHSVLSGPARTLVLDFGEVEFMDSSGIGIVLGRYRLMQELDGSLRLQNLPPHIRKVLRLAGVDGLKIMDKGGREE